MTETIGSCLGVMPGFGMSPEKAAEAAEKLKRRSNVDRWAERGLGNAVTAVEGFVEMMSDMLYREGCEVPCSELERWLDAYYQLRVEAEKEAELVKFASDTKLNFKPISIEPKERKAKCSEPTDYDKAVSKFLETVTLLAFVGALKPFYGPAVKDPDEKEAETACCCERDGHRAGDFICSHVSDK